MTIRWMDGSWEIDLPGIFARLSLKQRFEPHGPRPDEVDLRELEELRDQIGYIISGIEDERCRTTRLPAGDGWSVGSPA